MFFADHRPPCRLSSSVPVISIDINFISGIVRLDHKYELNSLYEQAMGYLTTYYTTDFNSWANGSHASDWEPEPIHAISAINLARLTNTPSILPAAFYICATLGPDIAVGFARAVGSYERLAPEDLRLCLVLKEALVAENASSAYKLFRSGPTASVMPFNNANANNTMCVLHGQCGDVLRRVYENAATGRGQRGLSSARALESWVAVVDAYVPPQITQMQFHGGGMFMQGPQAARGVCKNCRSNLETRDRELRKGIWRKLPEILGLHIEGWNGGAV